MKYMKYANLARRGVVAVVVGTGFANRQANTYSAVAVGGNCAAPVPDTLGRNPAGRTYNINTADLAAQQIEHLKSGKVIPGFVIHHTKDGTTVAHYAAETGNVKALEIIETMAYCIPGRHKSTGNPIILAKDSNGDTPLDIINRKLKEKLGDPSLAKLAAFAKKYNTPERRRE